MNQKGFAPIIIILGIVLILGIVGGAYFVGTQKNISVSSLKAPAACTQEAKICPDGSAVGRTGPNCEFSSCSSVPGGSFIPPTAKPTVKSEGNLPAVINLAKQDLAGILSINSSLIAVDKYDKVEWPDSSLGCPKAGNMYSQIITPGYKVLFSYNQKQYEYHTDLGSNFVSCK